MATIVRIHPLPGAVGIETVSQRWGHWGNFVLPRQNIENCLAHLPHQQIMYDSDNGFCRIWTTEDTVRLGIHWGIPYEEDEPDCYSAHIEYVEIPKEGMLKAINSDGGEPIETVSEWNI